MEPLVIRFLVYPEKDYFVARGLEYNFFSVSETLEGLMEELLRAVADQVEGDKDALKPPFHGYKPVPDLAELERLYRDLTRETRKTMPFE